MENLTRYKMETCECNNWDCDKVDAWSDPEGEWVKFSDIKELLQTANNNARDEICPHYIMSAPCAYGHPFLCSHWACKAVTGKRSPVA
jgi:hypothetical protein